ncbi:hypothetical protein ACSNOI_43330 [Actinomadura kijaniata]|uniref:hypothetical protein n=1 Tax=Actinomadura kijaniata TaxID=46161 RepID=UPI003F1D6C66
MSNAPPVSLTKPPTERSERGDEATRHLCAGVYLDRGFRDLVLRRIRHDTVHRVAPSYGFDLVPVVDHAWRCWVLETTQHACNVALLIIAARSSPPTGLTVVCALGLWGLAGPLLRLAPKMIWTKARTVLAAKLHKFMTVGEIDTDNLLKTQVQWLRWGLAGCGAMLTAPIVSAGMAGVPLPWVLGWAGGFLALLAFVTGALTAVRQRSLNSTQGSGPLRPARFSRRYEEIDRQQSHTVVVYRRPEPEKQEDEKGPDLRFPPDDEPNFFVGSGKLVHRWLPPLTVQLLRRRSDAPSSNGAGEAHSLFPDDMSREFVSPPFRAHELVEHLRAAMKPIGRPDDPTRLPGYQVSDRVYIAETDVPANLERLSGPCDPRWLHRIIDEPYGAAQHFLEIRTTSSGELVTTVFLRVTVKGRSLSLDFATCALTRTPPRYQGLDQLARHGTAATLRVVSLALCRLPMTILDAWRLVTAPPVVLHGLRARRGGGGWGRGPRVCVREEVAADWRLADFDQPVILDQMKIIELRLLTAVKDFLRARGVDTSAFEKRAETIISANVLNMGGRVDINNSAVGDNPQVNQATVVPHGSHDATVQGAHA